MPSSAGRKRNFNSKAGNLVLLTWCLMGSVIAYAFLCNLRAMFIKKQPARQIDYALDILELKKRLFIFADIGHHDFLAGSKDEAHRRVASEAVLFGPDNYEINNVECFDNFTHVYLGTKRETENIMYMEGFVSRKALYYYSREQVFPPTPRVWLLEKYSPWKESVDRHLMSLMQVENHKLQMPSSERERDTARAGQGGSNSNSNHFISLGHKIVLNF